jgi:Flp pilus assembly protein TadG
VVRLALPRAREDRGAAVVEFTLVSILLVFLFLAIMQVGLVLHARNVMVSAAQEGARFAANADRTADDGVARTEQALRGSLGSDLVARTAVTPLRPRSTPSGARVVGIQVSGPLPFLFVPVGPLRITVQGHALDEGAP